MRAILGMILLAGLFCAYWFGVGTLLRAAPDHLAARGVQMQALAVAGFPRAFDLRMDQPALPARGWRADWVRVTVPSYWPFSASGSVSGQQAFDWRGAAWQVAGADMPFSLATSPGLQVTRAALSGRDIRLSGPIRGGLDSLSLTLDPAESARQEYRLAVDMAGLVLAAFGQTVESASLDATLHYSVPLHLITASTLRQVRVSSVRIVTGPTQLDATGELTRSPDGRLEGDLTLTLRNWQPIMAALSRSGLLPPDQAPLLMMMAQGMSTGDTLTLPLSLRGSILSLGPLPLLDLGRF